MRRTNGITATIRRALAERAKTLGVREISRQCGVDHSRLSRFLRSQRQLTTGDDLDSLVRWLGISIRQR